MSYTYYVYILTNKKNGILYIGVTNDISIKIYEHKVKINKGFSNKYNLYKIVYCETFNSIEEAIIREKQLKHQKREWKIQLIEKNNPHWEEINLN